MRVVHRLVCFCIALSFTVLNLYCGSDPAGEAEKAFESGNYNLAIKLYLDARAKDPQNQTITEKIALAYMHRGQELFQKSNNIKSFSGNYEKALTYIPENPGDEFKKNYSKMLLVLAQGYLNSKPQNDIEKEDFLNKAISHLDDAIYNDQFNTQADSLLTRVKAENFQKMLDKGKELYSKAEKQKNNDLYFNAEYYFKKANEFDIYNAEAKKLLSRCRQNTLSVLNIKDDLAIAVADNANKAGEFILVLVLRNHISVPINIKLENFVLADIEGNTYALDKTTMDSKYASTKMKEGEISGKDMEGWLVYKVPVGVKLEYIGYKMETGQVSKKYFP
jgi:hypothetical protein